MCISLFFITIKPLQFFYRQFLPKRFKKSFNIFCRADFVIWNGRNFRGHGYWKELYNIFVLCFNPLVCIFLKKPIACIGASVWHLSNPLTRAFIRYMFRRCIFVSVRETRSMERVKELMRKEYKHIVQLPDLSFYYLRSMLSQPVFMIQNVEKRKQKSKRIGFTVVSSREIGNKDYEENYISAMKNLSFCLLQEKNLEIIVLPQVTFVPEAEDEMIREIFGNLNTSRVRIIRGNSSVQELLKEYSKLDFLVATRMHSAIFSLCMGTPVLAIAYDYGAKWAILEDMGLPKDAVIDINKIEKELLVSRFEDLWIRKEKIIQDIQEKLHNHIYPQIEEHLIFVKQFHDEYLQRNRK